LTHYGQHFGEIAYLYDHVKKRYTWAHNLVSLHYSDNQTDYPLYFQLWKPANLEKLEQGLLTAGIRLRESKFALKESNPKKWRHYLLGVWRRHQDKPEMAALYQSKLMIARNLLQRWVDEHPELGTERNGKCAVRRMLCPDVETGQSPVGICQPRSKWSKVFRIA